MTTDQMKNSRRAIRSESVGLRCAIKNHVQEDKIKELQKELDALVDKAVQYVIDVHPTPIEKRDH